jgi:hypothetical protein
MVSSLNDGTSNKINPTQLIDSRNHALHATAAM